MGRTANVGGEYPLESEAISQNIRDDYECRATGCTDRTPSVGVGTHWSLQVNKRRYGRTPCVG